MTREEINYRRIRLNNRINRMEAKAAFVPSVRNIINKCNRELRKLDREEEKLG